MGKIAPFVSFVRGRLQDAFLSLEITFSYITMASSQAFMTSADFNSSQVDKLKRKAQDAPFVPLGIAGMLGAVGYGAYSFKSRGNMSTSVFLMHLRVKAQGMVVGAMTLGVGWMLLNDHILKKPSERVAAKH